MVAGERSGKLRLSVTNCRFFVGRLLGTQFAAPMQAVGHGFVEGALLREGPSVMESELDADAVCRSVEVMTLGSMVKLLRAVPGS